jgi:hypothetical protein
MKFFIPSRPRDLPIADKCAAHLRAFGFTAITLLDRKELPLVPLHLPPDRVLADYATPRGMHGVSCALGLATAILQHTQPGDIVAKIDCDIRLTPTGAAWLSAVTTGSMAHAFSISTRAWGGVWAAPRETLIPIAEKLATTDECECPESNLFLSAFRHHGGISYHATDRAIPWLPGRPFPPYAAGYTLPTRTTSRLTAGLALFEAVIGQ